MNVIHYAYNKKGRLNETSFFIMVTRTGISPGLKNSPPDCFLPCLRKAGLFDSHVVHYDKKGYLVEVSLFIMVTRLRQYPNCFPYPEAHRQWGW